MDTLKVSVSWIITCLAKCFKTCLHKCANTAAKNSLLTKEVCFCFCSECCFKNTCSCAANTECVSKCKILSLTCSVLLNSNKTRYTLTSLILTSYCMTRSLRSDHSNINICRRNDLTKVNCKTVSEHKHIACLKVRSDILLVHSCLLLIVNKNHNNIGTLSSLCSCIYLKALCFCFRPRLTTLVKANDYITA